MIDKYFLVTRYPNDKEPVDIGFSPINSAPIPNEYHDFKSDVEQFVSIINSIFKNDATQRKHYFEKAFYAAQLGFSGVELDLNVGQRALLEAKTSLLNGSWIKIRNSILSRYGMVSIIGIILFSFVSIWHAEPLKNIPVILAGTCLGFWVAIAVKAKDIVFSDIQSSLNDYQSPALHIIFCCALSLIFSLLLSSGFIEVHIGTLSSASIATDKWIACCVGIMLGYSEKALSAKLTQKSSQFVGDSK